MSTTSEPADGEVIDLEPTTNWDLAGPGVVASPRPGPGLGTPEGSFASMAGETDTLKRQRLLAAAVFLAATFGLLCAWVFASDNPGTLAADGSRFSLRIGFIVLRCALAAIVAGLLASAVPLTRKQLRAVEYVLFLGITLVLMASQYVVGLDLIRRGPESLPIILAFIKDGVIQTVALMLIYGTLIPNRPAATARVVVAMFIGVVAMGFVVKLSPEAASMVGALNEAEESGSNILFLVIAAALAVYSSFLVNSLRAELHHARKFGQYQLRRKIGSGGMGEVYLAEHSLLKRPCALKLIRPEAGADPLALARFEREVQSSAKLAHHNTIEIYDFGHSDDGTFYYVMEFLHGMSLADMVNEYGPLPPGRVIYLFRQACTGLAEAHGLGLVHRDLKPGNLFIAVLGGESDVAKVLDFGLVKITESPGATTLTAELTVSGTPLYMAPEQAAADRSLDARADIYALGAMMYHALTGRPPFQGDNPFDVMIAHARDPVVPPSEVRPGIPEDLEQVVLRCLAKKPADRYPTVKALKEALAACSSASEWGPNRADAWWETVGAAALESAQADAAGPTPAAATS